MKIIYAITKSNWGGAQRYVYDLAIHSTKHKNQTLVLLGGNGVLKAKLDQAHIKTISLDTLSRDISISKDFNSFFTLWKILRQEKPDVFHVNSSKMGAMGALAGRLCGIKKIVFTLHGLAFKENRSSISKWFIRLSYYITFLLSHNVIAVSHELKKEIETWPLIKNKITVINNSVDQIDFVEKLTARNKIIGFQPLIRSFSKVNSVWIGAIAELHHIKGLEYLIQSLYKAPFAFTLIIIGEGEERKNLETLINKLHLNHSVFLTGHIDNAASLLKAFDIFALTSLYEGLAYVLLEAGLAEMPVVASKAGGIPEIIENMRTGILVKPKNPEDIKLGIEYIMKNRGEAARMASRLRQKVEEKFSLNQMLEKTFLLYKSN